MQLNTSIMLFNSINVMFLNNIISTQLVMLVILNVFLSAKEYNNNTDILSKYGCNKHLM